MRTRYSTASGEYLVLPGHYVLLDSNDLGHPIFVNGQIKHYRSSATHIGRYANRPSIFPNSGTKSIISNLSLLHRFESEKVGQVTPWQHHVNIFCYPAAAAASSRSLDLCRF
jgi:hypothetical protein